MHRLLLLVCTLGMPGLVYAQQPDVQAGTRIRVRPPPAPGEYRRWIEGTVSETRGDTVLFRARGGTERQVVRDAATPLLVYAGRRSSLGRGLAIGATTGLLGGAVLGFAMGEDCGGGWLCFDRGTMAAGGAIFFGGIGAVAGLVAGALSSHEIWRAPGAGAALRPYAGRSAGHLVLGGSLSF